MDFDRRKRPFRKLGKVIDIINVILSVVVIVCAVFVAVDIQNNILLFPVIFLCTGLINLALAIKFYKRNERFRFFTLMLGFIGFAGFGVFSLLVIF